MVNKQAIDSERAVRELQNAMLRKKRIRTSLLQSNIATGMTLCNCAIYLTTSRLLSTGLKHYLMYV